MPIPYRRLNRRGAVLLLFGLEFLIIGLSMVLSPTSAQTVPAYAVADNLGGLAGWGVAWMAVGVAGCAAAWLPSRRDDIGFYLLAGFTAVWAGLAFGSWILYDASRAWSGGLLFVVHALLLLIVSGMDRYGDE